MNVVACFSSDVDSPDMQTHLRPASPGSAQTLCGKKAMPPRLGSRHKITCPICKERKPSVLGGLG